MSVGILDLSIVTDLLRTHLKACAADFKPWKDDPHSVFDIDFTGLAPDAARVSGSGCHVSVYLFHVVPDRKPVLRRLDDGLPRIEQRPSVRRGPVGASTWIPAPRRGTVDHEQQPHPPRVPRASSELTSDGHVNRGRQP